MLQMCGQMDGWMEETPLWAEDGGEEGESSRGELPGDFCLIQSISTASCKGEEWYQCTHGGLAPMGAMGPCCPTFSTPPQHWLGRRAVSPPDHGASRSPGSPPAAPSGVYKPAVCGSGAFVSRLFPVQPEVVQLAGQRGPLAALLGGKQRGQTLIFLMLRP